MKYIIILIFLTISAFACTGDCMTCHPKLLPTINEDLRHKPMLTCINCHSAESSGVGECGDKCFTCHTMSKLDKANVREHDIIQTCINCHVGAKEKLFDISKSLDQSHGATLKDFLAK